MAFTLDDYKEAESYADAIMTNGENISGIFDDVDTTMKNLYGENWESAGAADAKAQYEQLRKNYEVFYTQVKNLKTTIYNSVDTYTASDTSANAQVSEPTSEFYGN